jgi:DNA-nicking Smr family endonuclease
MSNNKKHNNKYAHLAPKRSLDHLDNFVPEAQLDYHNRGSLSKFEIIQMLEDFLLESYTDGLEKVLIITGKGSVVRPLVTKKLRKSKYVAKSSKAGYYNGQSGAIEVYLKTGL